MDDGSPAFAGMTPVPTVHAATTLIHGRTFCLASTTGDIVADQPQGLFFLDTRIVSRFEVKIDGHHLEGLAVANHRSDDATFHTRAHPLPGHADSHLVVQRRRSVGRGMREVLTCTSFALTRIDFSLSLDVGVDFAHLFDVKQGTAAKTTGRHTVATPGRIRFVRERNGHADAVDITVDGEADDVTDDTLTWHISLAPHDAWSVCIQVTNERGGRFFVPHYVCGTDTPRIAPVSRESAWHVALPDVSTDDPSLAAAVKASARDLDALRIVDPAHPEVTVLAAGAPWYMTVFGRDSLITAWMTLLADPDLAHGVLRTLARLQGVSIDDRREEQPGKILHELRAIDTDELTLDAADVYFGSVDATPLFVMLLGEVARWQPNDTIVRELLEHADRALQWVDECGDVDSDGFVEYQRRNPNGLVNQGWKDSWDAIRHADGRLADGPIALCEVQGYVYGALKARAQIAAMIGDVGTAELLERRAVRLRARFDEAFWDEDLGCYALALDGAKQPVRVATSNAGHCLWSGIALPTRAARLADTLLGDDLFSGWGVRTLASSAMAFNPISYHNGSVWPHDNTLIADGLARYGFDDAARRIIRAQLDVAAALDGRLPELLAGFPRGEVDVPAAYPASCVPQAWAAAAPFAWLRTLLRLDVDAAANQLAIDPLLPEGMARLAIDGIRVAGRRLVIDVDHGRVSVGGRDGLDVRLGRLFSAT